METEIREIMYPYYLGVNQPAGYVLLGAQLYVREKDETNKIFAKQNPGPNDPFVKLDDSSSWGVSTDFVLEINGSNFPIENGSLNPFLKKYRDDYSQFRAPFGRLIVDPRPPYGTKLSSVLYFDRFGLNNDVSMEDELLREPGKPKYLNLSLASGKLYLILQNKTVQFCCKNNNLGEECGAGPNALNSKNPRCTRIAEGICTSSSPKDFFGQFCQREYCKTDPQSIKTGNCDATYRSLCNRKIDLSVSAEEYPYYKKYPDYCACFMGRDFLLPMCRYYADALGIKRNIKAQNALGLNVNDPNQCNQACKINPLCRLGAQVPYDMTRGDNPVVLGAGFPDECKEIDLCVQDVTVNQTGDNIGKLTINQTANCKTVLQKVCTNSTYTPCTDLTISGNKYTYKRKLLEDRDEGQCADPGTEFVCSEFIIDPVDVGAVSCDKKKEKISYNFVNTFSEAFPPNVQVATNHLINTMEILDKYKPPFMNTFKGSNVSYNPVTNIVTAEAECKNCVVGYTGGDCTLVQNNRKWTQYLSLTDILTPQKNGGEVCRINNTLLPVDCPLIRDCSLSFNKKDNYCIDGTYGYTYEILSYPSGNGKSCSDVALSMIGNELSNPTVQTDFNTIRASSNCNDCIVDFVEDENEPGGKCTLVNGQYLKKKFAKVVKKETSNGRCPSDKLNLVNTKASITEKCSVTQDCSFKSLSDDCDDNQGIRTLKFIKDNSSSGGGRNCEEVGEQISKGYDNVSSFDYSNNILTVNSTCEISSDCKVEVKSEKCESGKRKDIYDIIFKPKGRGKTCEDTVREIVNDTNLSVNEEGNKVIVEGSCPNFEELERKADTNRFGVISIVVFILIILFAIFFL
jgi:hypothetical protein